MLTGFIIGLIAGVLIMAFLSMILQEDLNKAEKDRDYYKSKSMQYLEMLNARKQEKIECPWESKDNCRVCKAEKE